MEVQIGRREVEQGAFIQAVHDSRSIAQVCSNIGFNPTVSTTRAAVKEKIRALGLDVSHFRKEYTYDKEKLSERRTKAFTLSENNQKYYDAFHTSISGQSWSTYKATIGNFLDGYKQDFALVKPDDILTFTKNDPNKNARLRSMLIYMVSNDINNARKKMYKETLIWLISNTAKKSN